MLVVTYEQQPGWITRLGFWWDARRGKVKVEQKPSPQDIMRENVARTLAEYDQRRMQDASGRISVAPPAAPGMKTCPGCYASFAPKRRNQKFHSTACRKAHWARHHPPTRKQAA